jgi:hypothetical protein
MIIEISFLPRTKDSSASIHIDIDGTEYKFLSCGTTVNILTGHALKAFKGKSLGKCFWDVASIGTHYKKNGAILMEYAKTALTMGKVCNA